MYDEERVLEDFNITEEELEELEDNNDGEDLVVSVFEKHMSNTIKEQIGDPEDASDEELRNLIQHFKGDEEVTSSDVEELREELEG